MGERSMPRVTMIDPPSGWKYGFPKVIPTDPRPADSLAWLVENGYPAKLIESYGDHFYCRHWECEAEEEVPAAKPKRKKKS